MGQKADILKETEMLNSLAEKAEKRVKRLQWMKQKMSAHGAFMRLLIYLQYQWSSLILYFVTIIIAAGILGVVAKIVWTIWLMIFRISL